MSCAGLWPSGWGWAFGWVTRWAGVWCRPQRAACRWVRLAKSWVWRNRRRWWARLRPVRTLCASCCCCCESSRAGSCSIRKRRADSWTCRARICCLVGRLLTVVRRRFCIWSVRCYWWQSLVPWCTLHRMSGVVVCSWICKSTCLLFLKNEKIWEFLNRFSCRTYSFLKMRHF